MCAFYFCLVIDLSNPTSVWKQLFWEIGLLIQVINGENPVSHSLCPTHVAFTPCLAWWDVCCPSFFGGKKLNGKGNAFCVLIYLTLSNWQWRLVDLSSNTSHSVLYSKVCELTVKRKIMCLFIIFVKIIVHVVVHMVKRASVNQNIEPVQDIFPSSYFFVPPFKDVLLSANILKSVNYFWRMASSWESSSQILSTVLEIIISLWLAEHA